jgi:hypothetical protein
MGETYRATSGGSREDGAAFDHTPTPGEGKPPAGEADEGRSGNALESGDLLAGKFTSQEELVKAYNELQQKLGGKVPPPDPNVDGRTIKEPEGDTPVPDLTPDADTDGLIKKVEDTGIDVEALNREFGETGELSQETMDGLTKRGIPQEMVEAYIAGQQSLATNAINTLAEVAGGKDQLAQTLQWAGENLSDAEIDAYNSAMQQGNVAITQTLLRGIVAAYRADVGEAPSNIAGESSRPAGVKPFASDAEMNLAMQDPRYSTDPTYRDSVIARIAASM